MLQNAAEMAAEQEGRTLEVTVTNNSGHKLPTGYPEGRRMWINVKFYDASMTLVSESCAYDLATGVLAHDEEAKIYEIKPGLDSITAPLVGVPEGPSFHFVLNNTVYKDNRIPPRGFTNAAYADFGGPPVDYTYADGQYWDETYYSIPTEAASAEVTLYYQSTSKEFIEFLRDENTTNTKGQELYDLWNENEKCPPEMMVQVQLAIAPPVDGDYDGDTDVDLSDYVNFPACMTGPEGGVLTDCEIFNFDNDNDVDLGDYAEFMADFTGEIDTTAPEAPTGLVASAGDAVVSLDWNDNTEPDLAGYNVMRALNSGGPYVQLNGALVPGSDYVDNDVVNGTTYYYVVTAVDTSTNESDYSDEASATPSVGTMHVESIVLSVDDQGSGNKYGVATVTIFDAGGAPVPNADVTGTFSGDFVGTVTSTTGGDGVAVLVIGPKGGRTDFSFCVDDVVHATYTYDPDANLETCDVYP
jgi:hypothetical protein